MEDWLTVLEPARRPFSKSLARFCPGRVRGSFESSAEQLSVSPQVWVAGDYLRYSRSGEGDGERPMNLLRLDGWVQVRSAVVALAGGGVQLQVCAPVADIGSCTAAADAALFRAAAGDGYCHYKSPTPVSGRGRQPPWSQALAGHDNGVAQQKPAD